MAKFEKPLSDIFTEYGQIESVRDDTFEHNQRKLINADRVGKFVNGQDFYSKDEQKKRGIKEIINFGASSRLAQTWLNPLEAITLANEDLFNVSIHSGLGPAIDTELSEACESVINPLIYSSTKFDNMWRTLCGEGYVKGGCPCVYDHEDEGAIPKISTTLLFPKGCSVETGDIPYAYEELDLHLDDLYTMLEDEDDSTLNRKAIKGLIETIKGQIRQDSDTNAGNDETIRNKQSHRDNPDSTEPITIIAWRFWEVRVDEKNNSKYVTRTEYVERYGVGEGEHTTGTGITVLSEEERAFEDADMWMTHMIFDEEIGGEKTTDTLRGVGEAHYRPSRAMEELKNRRYEGALMASIPTLIDNDQVDPADGLSFKLGRDAIAPRGFTADSILKIPDTSRALDPIIQDLSSTAAGIVGGDRSNNKRGQELRTQAVERQANTQQATRNRVLKAYKKLDGILQGILHRCMTISPTPGFEDYNLIKMFQWRFDREIVKVMKFKVSDDATEVQPETKDGFPNEPTAEELEQAKKIRKRIARKMFGYYVHLEVRVNRSGSGIDLDEEQGTAQFLLEFLNTGNVDPQLANTLRRMIVLLRTGRPELARMITQDPEPIRKDQQHLASSEWEIIIRRATAGEVYEINSSDVHEDHVIAHLIDAISFVNTHGVRPWDQLKVIQFSAAMEHVGKHLTEMRRLPETRQRVDPMFRQFQEVVKQASIIIQELEQERGENPEGPDLDNELKAAQIANIRAKTEEMLQKLGIKITEAERLRAQSDIRAAQNNDRFELMKRQAFVNEISKSRDFELRERQLQAQNTNATTT